MKEHDRRNLVFYRLSKAKDTLSEVDLLINNQLWNTAINRLYYACYYAVKALLIDKGIKAETHNGVRQMFGLHFIKTGIIDKELGKFYSDIFDMRQSGDYEDFIDFKEEDVLDFRIPAKSLIEKIEKLLGLLP
jgi:uncharacterized protein (UPF0332 family)